jgi:hypothetical protein
MATPDAREHAERLIEAHTARLRELEVMKARDGNSADPKVPTEIESIRIALAELQSHAPLSPIVEQARQVVREQYDSEYEFRLADEAARGRRQITASNELRDELLALKLEAMHARYLAARNFFLIGMTFGVLLLVAYVLLVHMRFL